MRDVNGMVDDRLEAAGRLLRRQPYLHPYPHCWRCGTALIYWGKPSWYIRTSERKADLVEQNQTIGWHPEHIRDGRMGEWLANNVDWALSRDRFWGTPLPVWRCDEGHVRCVGSLAELSELAGIDVTGVDPHRPAIDEVTLPAPTAAAGPTGHAPGGAGHRRLVRLGVDADRPVGLPRCAGLGRVASSSRPTSSARPSTRPAAGSTRCWPSTRSSRASTPYRNVLCLGHIVDADGRKMSKSVGNVIDPWEILSTRGADPLRWWMFSQGSPWTPTRVSFEVIDASMRDALLTLWNTWSFFTTYAALNGFDPADPAVPAPADRSMLDRWMLSRLHDTVARATAVPRRVRALSGRHGDRRAASTTRPTGTCGAAGGGSGAPIPGPTRPTHWGPRPPSTRCWSPWPGSWRR